MSFLRAFAESNAAQIAANIFQLLSSIIIARSLGPKGKGAYSATIAIYEITVYLALLGVGNGILYSASKRRDSIRNIVLYSLLLSLFSGLIAGSIILVLAISENPVSRNLNSSYLLIVVPLALISITQSNFTYLLYSQEKFRLAYFLSFLSSFMQSAFLILFWILKILNVESALLIMVISNAIPLTVLLIYAIKDIGISFKVDLSLLKEIFSISWKSYFISLMSYIIVRSDLVILNSLRGNYDVGIYSVAAALASRMLILTSPIALILAPKTIQDPRGQLNFQLKVSRNLVVAMGLLLLLADLLYLPAVRILYGSDYTASWGPFIILNLGILFLGLSNALWPYFLAKGNPPVALIAPAVAALTNILLNIILIPHFGYHAAAFTSSISYFIYFVIFLAYISKVEGISAKEALIPRKEEVVALLSKISSRVLGHERKTQN